MTVSRLARRILTILIMAAGLFGSTRRGEQAAAADVANPAADRVAGRVVDSSGVPIPGARVFASFDESDLDFFPPDNPVGTTTDLDGRYSLDWPDLGMRSDAPALWAVAAGHRVACIPLASSGPRPPTSIALNRIIPAAGASFEVFGPAGEPVADARIVPTLWYETHSAARSARLRPIPRGLGELVAGKTGADGRLVLKEVAALRLAAVVVESRFGSQVASWDESVTARHRVIRLRSTGRVRGRIESDQPDAVGGRKIRITTTAGDRTVGRVEVTSDATGRFQVDEVAAGLVEVRVEPNPAEPLVARRIEPQALGAGGEIAASIPLERGIRIVGTVRDRDDQRPIADAWVGIWSPANPSGRCYRTDGAGRFTATARPGAILLMVESAPIPYLLPPAASKPIRVEVAGDEAEVAAPVLELDRGSMVRGTVIDLAGKPVGADLMVHARWTERDGRTHREMSATGSTTDGGDYTLGPVANGVDLALTVHRSQQRDAATTQLSDWDGSTPVDLRLAGLDRSFMGRGRVLDDAGLPVAGALVQVRVADLVVIPLGRRFGRRIAVDGLDAVVTDESGRYTLGGWLDDRHRYLVSAEARGCEWGRTRPVAPHPGSSQSFNFPDVIVHRHPTHSSLAGQVLNADRQPIPGVMIRAATGERTQTDETGSFRLERAAASGPLLLFARAAGYRFAGRLAPPSSASADRPIEWTLDRTDGPCEGLLGHGPTDLFPRVLTTLIIRGLLVDPGLERIMSRHDPAATATLLEHMAAVDPARVARWLQHGIVADRRTADGLRGIVARRLAADDADAAEVVVATIEDPVARGRAILSILDRAAVPDIERRRTRVKAVEREARSIDDPGARVVSLARVAESWLATGDLASARRTLDDAEKIAASLPRAGAGAKAWSALVPVLVKLDPAAAGRRLENLIDPHDADHCRLALAIRWYPVDPQAAIRMMATIRSPATKLRGIPQVCYLLAPVDRAGALGLANSIATIHPAIHAYSLGMIAAGCRTADRKFARETLGTAFTVLAAHHGTGNPPTLADPVPPSVIAAALLPVVEAVDPASLPEYFWTAMALHIHGTESPAGSDAMLALLLDRYHPEVARLDLRSDEDQPDQPGGRPAPRAAPERRPDRPDRRPPLGTGCDRRRALAPLRGRTRRQPAAAHHRLYPRCGRPSRPSRPRLPRALDHNQARSLNGEVRPPGVESGSDGARYHRRPVAPRRPRSAER